jgi:hypothetical protein
MVLQPVYQHVQVDKKVHLWVLRLDLLQGVEGLGRFDVAAGGENERHQNCGGQGSVSRGKEVL